MTTFLLIRHGLTDAVNHCLAGVAPGIRLNGVGRTQVTRLVERLHDIPLTAIVSRPARADARNRRCDWPRSWPGRPDRSGVSRVRLEWVWRSGDGAGTERGRSGDGARTERGRSEGGGRT